MSKREKRNNPRRMLLEPLICEIGTPKSRGEAIDGAWPRSGGWTWPVVDLRLACNSGYRGLAGPRPPSHPAPETSSGQARCSPRGVFKNKKNRKEAWVAPLKYAVGRFGWESQSRFPGSQPPRSQPRLRSLRSLPPRQPPRPLPAPPERSAHPTPGCLLETKNPFP
jgi:hypothetical protein